MIMIRPLEITLISKLTFLKSAQTSNSFGLKNRFSFDPRWAIRVDLVRLLYLLHDWFKKLVKLYHPIRSKTNTNRDSYASVFPRFVPVHVFSSSFNTLIGLCLACDWPEWLLWFSSFDTQWNCSYSKCITDHIEPNLKTADTIESTSCRLVFITSYSNESFQFFPR